MKIKLCMPYCFVFFYDWMFGRSETVGSCNPYRYTSTEFPELGSSVCYLNERGDTVIPFGKYHYGGRYHTGISVL